MKPTTTASLPEITVADPNQQSIIILAIAFQAIPLLFNALVYGEWNPLLISGPQFLGYYAVFCICMMIPYALHMQSANKLLSRQIMPLIPEDVNVFQASAITEGRHRATQTAILDLLQRELIGMSAAGFHIQYGMEVPPVAGEQNPLRRSLHASYPPGSIVDYHCLWELYEANEGFMHRGLTALETTIKKSAKDRWYILCTVLLVLIAILRAVLGSGVSGLFAELFVAWMVFNFLWAFCSTQRAASGAMQEAVFQRLTADHATSLGQNAGLYQFALEGTPSIADRMNGALLIALLGHYARTDADSFYSSNSGNDDE